MLVVTLVLAFIASFCLVLTVLDGPAAFPAEARRRKEKGESVLSPGGLPLAQPLYARVVDPLLVLAGRWARPLTPRGAFEHIETKLVLAGSPRDLNEDRWIALKFLSAAAGLLCGILIGPLVLPGLRGLLPALLSAGTGFFLPDVWLARRISARQKAIRLALPDTLDLLTISVEAGLGFDGALAKVVRNTSGPLAEEFYRMLQEIQLGAPRKEAFRRLGERTNVAELGSFVLAMLQADTFGISISKVLRVQAGEMRTRRTQAAEEIAMKAPVKIVFPLVLCIFPALLIAILGPAVIRIYETLVGRL